MKHDGPIRGRGTRGINNGKSIILKFLIVVGLVSLAFGQTQEARPLARHPGEVIKFQIKFDGPNADKITRVNGGFNLNGPVPKDQAGFDHGIGASTKAPSSPKTFDLELNVPDNIATGEYTLGFTGFAAEGYGEYANGQDFNIPPIHIENPKKFMPPSVTVKQLP
jgi:hypothetical protein